MSSEFTISAVSEEKNSWTSAYGTMMTYRVKLTEHGDETIQLNKKADSPAPQVGDKLYGDIEASGFGPKFKSAKRPFAGGGGGYQRDDAAIKAQWAINASLQLAAIQVATDVTLDMLEDMAKDFYAMIDRVKGSKEL